MQINLQKGLKNGSLLAGEDNASKGVITRVTIFIM